MLPLTTAGPPRFLDEDWWRRKYLPTVLCGNRRIDLPPPLKMMMVVPSPGSLYVEASEDWYIRLLHSMLALGWMDGIRGLVLAPLVLCSFAPINTPHRYYVALVRLP